MANHAEAKHVALGALRSIGSQSAKCEPLLSAPAQGLTVIANIVRHGRVGGSRALLAPNRQPDSLD
jgi:hypothetical protein